MKYLITFGVQYGPDVVHPTLPGITGKHYLLIEGDDYRSIRDEAQRLTHGQFAFDYPYEGTGYEIEEQRTRQMIARYELIEWEVGDDSED